VERQQPLVADARDSGGQGRQSLRKEPEGGVAVWLLEGFAAEAFGLAGIEVCMDRRLLPRGAAERGVVTIERNHKHRGCPASAASLPGGMQDTVGRPGSGLNHRNLDPLLPWADVQRDRG
jgi:hypothetical protein